MPTQEPNRPSSSRPSLRAPTVPFHVASMGVLFIFFALEPRVKSELARLPSDLRESTDRRDPGGFMQVRFKQFADDFDAIELRKEEGPSIEEMGDMIPLMVKLRQVATKQKLDLTDAFEEVTRP